MDRRDFLTAKRKKTPAASQQASRNITSGINPYSGPWTENEIVHLLKRTMFGAKKADVDYFRSRTMSQSVDELLNPIAPQPAPPIKEYVTSTQPGTPDANIAQGTTWVNDINNDGTVQSQRRGSYKKWWTGAMINQDRSIREKIVMFWVDHFGNETADIGNGNWAYTQQNLIRQYALSNFKQMVDAITKDVMMLRYLNGYLNIASAPDENYARELMELFTLGKGPGSQYTENDVREAAKVLTGWQINGTTYTSVFNPARHSTVNKTFSSFFNNTVITGRTGATAGQLELTDLLNMIFATQEAAKFIVRKFYRFFVYYTIDSATENNVITPLADIFRSNNYDIKPVLSALFKSEHFFDVLNQNCYIKNPADHVIGSLREMNTVFPALSDWDTNYGMWNFFYSTMVNTGLNLHDPPNVAGMPAYYQEPLYHEIWINSDSLPKRNQFTDAMSNNGFTRNGIRVNFNFVNYVQQFSNPGNPNDLIDDALKFIFRNQLSYESKKTIKTQILLSNQQWDYYWTNAWAAYMSSPTTANFNIVNNRLKSLFQYFFNLAEYQLS
ncbi:MAG: DUF1800 domain-containing protein [Chitinophagaceae bacterium]|nr:DUF1800 domain-containing protein [Chitinophagaceae bacterium]MBK8299809.1 DUF1800 domain-containing protein [Chitinophagaceae bacterium]MBK9659026.1 DUF1800 domain-containing protein [Chitinophagaceae bacterium]MBL0067471.1 DUF1800 domain-containing protein [Chitinophagaceae bacterium]MBP6416552.1 DUF1800 domain-containing protein [Chitinophagaceae bacterium]